MKILFTFFLLITFFNNTEAQNKMEKLNSILVEVKEKFAPDKRVAIFSIEAAESESKIILNGETNLAEAKTELARLLKESKIDFEDQVEVLPSPKLDGMIYGVIKLSVANFRSKPDHPAELVTQSILGTPLK